MTDIQEKTLDVAAKQCGRSYLTPKALRDWYSTDDVFAALCRAIERHEAFAQEVSDALSVYQKAASAQQRDLIWDALTRFIISKPDPLVEALTEAFSDNGAWEPCDGADANALRAAIEKRGGKIVWGEG